MSPRSQRRIGVVAVAALVLAVAALAVRPLLSRHQGDRYRVDAIFDVARGIGPDQAVKIAGAQVGTVRAVTITADNRARVQMSIEPRFAPFRANARCAIKPEGLISENFVDCAPGTPDQPVLAGATVAVERTSAPVSLQDLFDIWNVPTAQRLGVLISDLGLGLAADGTALNHVLERANPALTAARHAIAVVNRQRTQLEDLVQRAAPVVGRLARRSPDVQRFITQSARAATVTGDRAANLRLAIHRLPPLLRAARPALAQLQETAAATTPLLRDLRGAAPALTQVTADLPPLSTSAVAALRALDRPAADARTALERAKPVLARLGTFAAHADPVGRDLDRLLVSLRDHGALETLLRTAYNVSGLTNSYDATSHILLGNLSSNQCVDYARTPTPGCDAHLDGGDAPKPRRRARRLKPPAVSDDLLDFLLG